MDTFDKLLQKLKKGTIDTKSELLRELAEMDAPTVTSEISKYLSNKSPRLREVAAECLGNIGGEEAINALLQCLNDRHWTVRRMSVESLGRLLAGKQNCPSSLTNLLDDKDELVRTETCETLEYIDDKRVVDLLCKKLHTDRSPLVRQYAAIAIGSLGNKEKITELALISQSEKSPRAKVGIYEGLYKLGDTTVLPNLLGLINNEDSTIRCAVANTLSDICTSPPDSKIAYQALQEALRNEHTVAARSTIESCIKRLLGKTPCAST